MSGAVCPGRLTSCRAESAARDRLRSSWLGCEQEVGVFMPDPAGPDWCPCECAAPCSIGETPSDKGSGVGSISTYVARTPKWRTPGGDCVRPSAPVTRPIAVYPRGRLVAPNPEITRPCNWALCRVIGSLLGRARSRRVGQLWRPFLVLPDCPARETNRRCSDFCRNLVI